LNRVHLTILLTAGIALLLSSSASAQIFKLVSPDTTAGNFFGTAVAISGDFAVVGASGDTTCGTDSGAAYIFHRSENEKWTLSARLLPKDCKEGLFFGRSVAISGDRAIVTAYMPFFSSLTSNSVYVFEQNDETNDWEQTARLQKRTAPTEGPFASAVAIDGDRILVSTAGDTSQGKYSGAAYIFDYDGSRWRSSARLTPSLGPAAGVFGTSVALEGDRAVISASTYLARKPGTVYVFDRDPLKEEWKESAILDGIRDFFISVDVDRDRIVVGESRGGPKKRGQARIFSRSDDGRWRESATLSPSKKYSQGGFGSIVSIAGDRVLIVGFEEQLSFDINIDRVVYVYAYDPESDEWKKDRIVDVGNVAFGSAIDLEEGMAVIGMAADNVPGEAYVVLVH
jgi:FG-GAP repeat